MPSLFLFSVVHMPRASAQSAFETTTKEGLQLHVVRGVVLRPVYGWIIIRNHQYIHVYMYSIASS